MRAHSPHDEVKILENRPRAFELLSGLRRVSPGSPNNGPSRPRLQPPDLLPPPSLRPRTPSLTYSATSNLRPLRTMTTLCWTAHIRPPSLRSLSRRRCGPPDHARACKVRLPLFLQHLFARGGARGEELLESARPQGQFQADSKPPLFLPPGARASHNAACTSTTQRWRTCVLV